MIGRFSLGIFHRLYSSTELFILDPYCFDFLTDAAEFVVQGVLTRSHIAQTVRLTVDQDCLGGQGYSITGKLIIGKLSEFIGVCPINSDKFIGSDKITRWWFAV